MYPAATLFAVLAADLFLGPSAPVAPVAVIPLQAPLDHVQGIETDGRRLWVTEVRRGPKTGFLHEFELPTGKLLRSADLTQGVRYHPGGIAGNDTHLWVPMAEYRPRSSATILKVRKSDLAAETAFEVADHIGAVAVNGNTVYAANWDARQVYVLPGTTVRDNRSGTSFQDLKFYQGQLVGGGGRGRGVPGAIDWLDPQSLEMRRRIEVGQTDRGVSFTHEGLAIREGRIYLLPEDGPSRLFIFPVPE